MAAEITPSSPFAWRPDATAPIDAVPDALILKTSTVAGMVEGDAVAVRVQFVDDATAGFVAEGSTISEADPDLAECVVNTGKIAQLIRLSREQYHQPNAQSLLAESVQRAVTRAANAAYIGQVAPTAPAVTPPTGLINVAGINGSGTAITVADSLDALIDLQATIQESLGNPTHFVLSPTAWASLRKLKTGTSYNSSLLGAGVEDTNLNLLGVPVIVDPGVPEGKGLLLDKTAVVSAVGHVMVTVSDQIYFNSDSYGVRCTWRFGQNVVHPARIGVFSV